MFLLLVCAAKIYHYKELMTGSQNKHWIASNLPDLSCDGNL